MGSATKVKACFSCTIGKRKCDKAQPACGRCRDRDIECRYPLTKRKTPHAPAAESEYVSRNAVNEVHSAQTDTVFPSLPSDLVDPQEWTRSLGNLSTLVGPGLQDDTESSTTTSNQGDATHFFLKPDAWVIRHIPFTTPTFSNSICMNYVKGIHEFFREWVTNGHSSFMHRQLYADSEYPTAIQDAFASITLHNARTPSNEDIVDGIISSKVSALLKSYPQADGDVDASTDLDIREHLSRTQALYVHLVLALFSSSIGVRANAEQQIQTLLSWTRQLWEAALRDPDICQSESSDGSAASTNAIVLDVMFDGDTTPRLWRSWVLSESIRRIWLMTTSTIGVYLTLRQKWAECHGGIYFTARKDLWQAKSASSWAYACQSSSPLFICSLECESLFLTAKAPDIDELLINMFTIMWGIERVENWFARTAEPGRSVRVWRDNGPAKN
ncbi:hypothetical protein FVEN_g3075 [Fusarium venenatum]|uniref:Zn(2)-C6 fungal-type domain-containing protein n=1 Tax=Fusarium venenatum TaxID=56646 RepID=A0A2L2SWD5_9HYPO|nr:uncharacterized protein FVRRES_06478 [Fusarium venenatum]KAG8359528.1 hypothetical protein FVEN_g3075 [Fusarium venenatum]CEI62042.1 unnamed protein product [Fusarium venenatum]